MKAIVVGAGLSGLMCARTLTVHGHDVTVFDKGRSAGGRMATRRIGDARLDHGAQFFTARSEEFSRIIAEWVDRGVAREWCRGFAEHDGHPRWVGVGGMTTIAKHLAGSLDVRYGHLAFSLRRDADTWLLTTDDGRSHDADCIVLTAPIPQSMSLLVSAGVDLPADLRSIDYDRTIGLLVTLAGDDHLVPPPGGMQSPDAVFSFIGDNHRKGISERAALTFHANPAWSLDHYDVDTDTIAALLMEAASPYLGHCGVLEHQVKKWRFAIPKTLWPEPCWLDPTGTLALAGDAFAGPRVEGAVLSGLAAGRALASV